MDFLNGSKMRLPNPSSSEFALCETYALANRTVSSRDVLLETMLQENCSK